MATSPSQAEPCLARLERRFLIGALLVASACATTPPGPESREVDDLTIEGTKELSERKVKEKLATGESSWLPWWVPGLGRVEWYDETTWQADLRRITRFYEANGYYQVRLLEEKVTERRPGHVALLVKLTEGSPTTVTSLEVRGLEALPVEHRARVLEGLPLKPRDVFVEQKWLDAKAHVAARLRELGYAEVVVTGEALVDSDASTATAAVVVTPGLRYRFGQILVATDPGAQVPPRYITEQATPDITPGDWYSESALAEAQARVFQLGVFSAVKVNRAAPDRDEGTVPVVIDVREAPFRSVRLGFGLGGDNVRQEVRLVGEFTHRNLGLARLFDKHALLDRLTVKGKLGVAFLPTLVGVLCTEAGACLPGLTRGAATQWGPVGQAAVEYEVPRLFNRRTLSLQTALNLSRALEPAYDYLAAEVKLGVRWQPTLDVTVFPSVNFDTYLLNSEITPGANAPTGAIGCPRLPAMCLIGFLDVTTEWDRRDNKLEPHVGFYAALAVQVGLSQTAQVTPFVRLLPEGRGYVSFGKDQQWTLAGKLRAGTLLAPRNDTPIIARFFSGGAFMRGFSQRRLAPLVALNGQTLPIGGSGLVEASLELRWNVWEQLVLATFVDAGTVTWEPLGAGVLRTFYAAVGLGARYRTPLGPIRFDVAYRLPLGGPQRVDLAPGAESVEYPVNGGCFFGLGYDQNPIYAGAPENLCTWHLSIGEAF